MRIKYSTCSVKKKIKSKFISESAKNECDIVKRSRCLQKIQTQFFSNQLKLCFYVNKKKTRHDLLLKMKELVLKKFNINGARSINNIYFFLSFKFSFQIYQPLLIYQHLNQIYHQSLLKFTQHNQCEVDEYQQHQLKQSVLYAFDLYLTIMMMFLN